MTTANPFAKVTTEGLEEAGDYLGGGGTLETGIYTGTIKVAYAGQSASSPATSLTLHIDVDGDRTFEYRQAFWVTGKSGDNFYLDKKDPKKKHPLMGFTAVNDACLLTTGKELSDQTFEEKVVNLYDFDAKKEMPKNVMVATDMIGEKVMFAITKQIVDKTEKVGEAYIPTGETREQNEINKFMRESDGMTVTEIKAESKEAVWGPKWLEKNEGKTQNRAKGTEGKSATGASGAPAKSATEAPKKSLFSK